MSETVASAVAIVPDYSDMDSDHNGLKRRQSDASEVEENKRQRTSAGKISPEDPLASNTEYTAPRDSPDHTAKPAQKKEESLSREAARRRSAVPDDKQRSKRLFGALLGNLNVSQPSDRTVKRRADIEARRKAELAKQDNERLEDRQRRMRDLAQHRKRKQIFVDEENMHTRHRNLLDMANMLQTKAEPKLYYRPWDLLSDEEDRIEDQLAEAHTRVDGEVAEFEIEKKKKLATLDGKTNDEESRSDRERSQPVVAEAKQADSEKTPHLDSADSEPASKPADPDNNNDSTNGGEASGVAASNETSGEAVDVKMAENIQNENENEKVSDEKQEQAEDDGDHSDHIVEGDEDDVIY